MASPLKPTGEQFVELYVIVVFTIVIFALWVLPLFSVLINPLKLFTIGWHELCHVAAAIMSGGTIISICIDPHLGGSTRVMDGKPVVILCAGYIGSTLLGGLFVLASWSVLGSKIVSFIIGFGLIAPVVIVRDLFTLLCIIGYEGLLVGFWFLEHGQGLRWYVLFVGVMNILYVVWDVIDERVYKKQNSSDALQFHLLFPDIPSYVVAWLWILFELTVFVAFILIGLVAFKQSNAQMNEQASNFLPT